ncbi:MAG: hypothetical protein ACI814_004187 [Mariniblastus sp.]|jgi:hypothetical protein
MEFWTEVCRQLLVEGLSKRGAVHKYRIGWHTLNKILALEEPPGDQQKQARPKPKLDAFLPIISDESNRGQATEPGESNRGPSRTGDRQPNRGGNRTGDRQRIACTKFTVNTPQISSRGFISR